MKRFLTIVDVLMFLAIATLIGYCIWTWMLQ
jgi:hypothetical protein